MCLRKQVVDDPLGTSTIDSERRFVEQAIDMPFLARWLGERTTVRGSLSAERILGGRSNLTFFVRDDSGATWVLRRPPMGALLAHAHEVAREARILAGLRGAIAVPEVIGSDVDPSGTAFFVMRRLPGTVLRSRADLDGVPLEARARLGITLVRTLARLHTLDPRDVGLADLGKQPERYLDRQISLWERQGDHNGAAHRAQSEAVREQLLLQRPDEHPVAIVHGDYRLDNVLVSDDGEILGVLDWELCTRGHPKVDLAIFLLYWTEPDDPFELFPDAPTTAAGFVGRADLIREYGALTGSDLGDLAYYEAFAAWRMAQAFDGILRRATEGAYGHADETENVRIRSLVPRLIDRAAALLAEGK